MGLSGKTALVTGGSRGIGLAIAGMLAENGADVIITARDQDRLKKAASGIGATGIAADIRSHDQVKDVVRETAGRTGRIDILVNNAGIFPGIKKLHEIGEDEWNDVLDVNLTGQFRFTREAVPHMEGGGVILNISSDAGLKAYQGFNADAYSASKAALIALTRCWALEYAADKIRVNCICPGVVETDMTRPFLRTQKNREFVEADHPIGRIGTPKDVARAALYLVSDDSSWTTGAVLAVDGGESTK
ncbi:MAG: SDR family oxidoreductase [Nitrosopumilus sp. H8]|nr:MAG: SDR family oxidoreductase [Nitrosopumilus sp. H13]RNJ79731.1 MAG: SDR family oxidoreductase [Nitrosopumilus sp. H8]